MSLMKADFLITYPQFGEVYRDFNTEFSRYMDQDFKYIELAVKCYYSKILSDNAEYPDFDIKCEKKGPEEGGIQGGLICRILQNQNLFATFYVKEHMGLANGRSADVREIFVYKCFEMLGVGPKVHFIPNTLFSSFGLYIGTAEVPGFRRADEGLEISSEVYAQRDLLRRILLVKDLHSKNYGIDGNGKLSIIDLQIKNCSDPQMVHKYLDGYKAWKGSKELRIQVAKEFIDSSNLLDVFDNTNVAISHQKELFKKHSIACKPSQDFNEYFSQIKRNLNVLMKRLELN